MNKIARLNRFEKIQVFKLYSSGARPPEWKEEFEFFEQLENKIKTEFSHLPNNRVMARHAVLNYFNEYSADHSPDEG